MSYQHWPVKFEGVEHSQDVITKAIGRVSGSGNAGRAIPAPRNSVYVILRGKFGCEVVIDVSCVSETRQQDYGPACPAPIQQLQLDVLIDDQKLHLMR
jgi:uncharacterized protein (UPF0210 family)